MPHQRKKRVPGLRHHKATGQAFVELNGRRIYLGRFDLPETRQRYHRKIAEWLSCDREPPVAPAELTVSELAARFWKHAQAYYLKPDGTPTSMLDNYRMVLRPLKELYGSALATDFGPRSLKAVRDRMVQAGWCRSVVNQGVNLVRSVFRWGVAEELVPPDKLAALRAVAPLRKGRCAAPDLEGVQPVPDDHISAIRSHVSRQVWALVNLQLRTGARAGELVRLRPVDLDTSHRDVWTATVGDHKTAHTGRSRALYFGPRAQEVLREFLVNRPVDAYLFSPREAVAERARAAPTHRRPGQPQNPRKSDRRVREHYSVGSYRRAIQRGCAEASIPQWTPHRLRHTAATIIRREFGLEAAQVILGHASADVTQVYAERDVAKAVQVAAKIG